MHDHTSTDTHPETTAAPVPHPRVELVGLRDPDGDTDITVFLDGQQVTTTEQTIVDPGKGWDLDDWRESRDDAATQASPAAAALIRCMYDAGETSEFVRDTSGDHAAADADVREIERLTATGGERDGLCFDCQRAFNADQPIVAALLARDSLLAPFHVTCWNRRHHKVRAA